MSFDNSNNDNNPGVPTARPSEIERDHRNSNAASDAARALAAVDKARHASVTTQGAPRDLEGIRIESSGVPVELHPNALSGSDERDDNNLRPVIDDGTAFITASELPQPNSELLGTLRSRYPDADIASVERDHAARLKQNGNVPPSTNLGVPSTYRK